METESFPIFGICPVSLLTHPDVTLRMLKVYIAISSFQGLSSACWPSHAAICARSGIQDTRNVKKAIEELLSLKLLQKKARFQDNKQLTNTYTIMFPVESKQTQECPTTPGRMGETPPGGEGQKRAGGEGQKRATENNNENNKEHDVSPKEEKKPLGLTVLKKYKELVNNKGITITINYGRTVKQINSLLKQISYEELIDALPCLLLNPFVISKNYDPSIAFSSSLVNQSLNNKIPRPATSPKETPLSPESQAIMDFLIKKKESQYGP